MHPHQNGFFGGQITFQQDDMFGTLGFIRINAQLPLAAELGGDRGFLLHFHQIVVATAKGDQIADRSDLQIVELREGDQIGKPRHGAVFVHDLANHARGFSPARRATSTAASVWPARTRTPPVRARNGKTWPGVAISAELRRCRSPPQRCAPDHGRKFLS